MITVATHGSVYLYLRRATRRLRNSGKTDYNNLSPVDVCTGHFVALFDRFFDIAIGLFHFAS
jgi:hypothetical protein